jgi:hypothetical protein
MSRYKKSGSAPEVQKYKKITIVAPKIAAFRSCVSAVCKQSSSRQLQKIRMFGILPGLG